MKTFLLLVFIALTFVYCQKEKDPIVIIETELGDIELEIYKDKAPKTASNFLTLVGNGVYDGACFYRVVRLNNQPNNQVKIEVIQGGLKKDQLINAYQAIIHETTEETGIKHLDGVISMARIEPGTASTEFFICVGDQPELDFRGERNPDGQGFAAFGRVIKGMDVVRDIQSGQDDGQILKEVIKIQKAFLEK